MAFRNEKQSLGCLKMGLKDSWSFSHFKKKFRTLERIFRTLDFKVRNSRSALRSLSSNGHNFFVSNPNHAPFEELDS